MLLDDGGSDDVEQNLVCGYRLICLAVASAECQRWACLQRQAELHRANIIPTKAGTIIAAHAAFKLGAASAGSRATKQVFNGIPHGIDVVKAGEFVVGVQR